MAQVRARFDGKVFVPEAEVDLPEGTVVEFDPVLAKEGFRISDLATLLPDTEGTPDDLAAQHGHYLHGTPKRP